MLRSFPGELGKDLRIAIRPCLISASCIQENGRDAERPRGSNSAEPTVPSGIDSGLAMKGTDFDMAAVHLAGAEQTGATADAEPKKDEKETAEVGAKAYMVGEVELTR
jgi:hypothetical protein